MTGPTDVQRFIVSYGPRPRVWCERCDKATAIGHDGGNGLVDPQLLAAAERDHRCGPRATAWTIGDGR